MARSAEDDVFKAQWKQVSLVDRWEITKTVRRGGTSPDPAKAALTAWAARRELRSVRLAPLLGLLYVMFGAVAWWQDGSVFPLYHPGILGITWLVAATVARVVREPKLKSAIRLNRALAAGDSVKAPQPQR
jgi:hypothetical protein